MNPAKQIFVCRGASGGKVVTLAMHERGLSYPEIAAWFGRHSHSAFIYLHRRAVGRLGDAANQLSEAINA